MACIVIVGALGVPRCDRFAIPSSDLVAWRPPQIGVERVRLNDYLGSVLQFKMRIPCCVTTDRFSGPREPV
jgi:hypothetical protein